jgi:hypothetical protein
VRERPSDNDNGKFIRPPAAGDNWRNPPEIFEVRFLCCTLERLEKEEQQQ